MKDLTTVADYQLEEKLKFLRGMAFNNASLLLSGRKYEKETLTCEMVFDLAEQLFDEAKKRDYWNYGKVNKTPAISVAKVEKVFPELKVDMTEKEGSKMGVEEEQELMI